MNSLLPESSLVKKSRETSVSLGNSLLALSFSSKALGELGVGQVEVLLSSAPSLRSGPYSA